MSADEIQCRIQQAIEVDRINSKIRLVYGWNDQQLLQSDPHQRRILFDYLNDKDNRPWIEGFDEIRFSGIESTTVRLRHRSGSGSRPAGEKGRATLGQDRRAVGSYHCLLANCQPSLMCLPYPLSDKEDLLVFSAHLQSPMHNEGMEARKSGIAPYGQLPTVVSLNPDHGFTNLDHPPTHSLEASAEEPGPIKDQRKWQDVLLHPPEASSPTFLSPGHLSLAQLAPTSLLASRLEINRSKRPHPSEHEHASYGYGVDEEGGREGKRSRSGSFPPPTAMMPSTSGNEQLEGYGDDRNDSGVGIKYENKVEDGSAVRQPSPPPYRRTIYTPLPPPIPLIVTPSRPIPRPSDQSFHQALISERQSTDYSSEMALEPLVQQFEDVEILANDDPSVISMEGKVRLAEQPGVINDHESAVKLLTCATTSVSQGRVTLKYMKMPLMDIQIDKGETRGFLLADNLGFGKTLVGLSIIVKDMIESKDHLARSTLIICPSGIARSVWKEEIDKRTIRLSEQVKIVTDLTSWLNTLKERSLNAKSTKIVIVTIEFLRRYLSRNINPNVTEKIAKEDPVIDLERLPTTVSLSDLQPQRIIVDEVQGINNDKHVVGRKVADVCHRAEFTLLLSATPFRTNIRDLYLTLKMIGATASDSVETFLEAAPKRTKSINTRIEQLNWAKQLMKDQRIYMMRGRADSKHHPRIKTNRTLVECEPFFWEDDLQKLFTAKLLERVSKTLAVFGSDSRGRIANASIPPGHIILQIFYLMALATCSYEAFESHVASNVDEACALFSPVELATIRKQYVQSKWTAKMKKLQQHLLSRGSPDIEKTVILVRNEACLAATMQAIEEAGFVRWTEGERFPGSKYYVVYSPDMDRAEKEKALCDLSDEPDIRLILGLMGGLEVGHNLQACSYMYLVEPCRSAGEQFQIEGRIARLNQAKLCTIVQLNTIGSSDELVENLIEGQDRDLGSNLAPDITYNDILEWLEPRSAKK